MAEVKTQWRAAAGNPTQVMWQHSHMIDLPHNMNSMHVQDSPIKVTLSEQQQQVLQ